MIDILLTEQESDRNQAELLVYLFTQILDYSALSTLDGNEKITHDLLIADFAFASTTFLMNAHKNIEIYYNAFFSLLKGFSVVVPKEKGTEADIKLLQELGQSLDELEKHNNYYTFKGMIDSSYKDSKVFNRFINHEPAPVQMSLFLWLVDYLLSSQPQVFAVMESYIKKKQKIAKVLALNLKLIELENLIFEQTSSLQTKNEKPL